MNEGLKVVPASGMAQAMSRRRLMTIQLLPGRLATSAPLELRNASHHCRPSNASASNVARTSLPTPARCEDLHCPPGLSPPRSG